MTERCTFFRTEIRTVRANAIRPGAPEGPPKREMVGFCAHSFSPAPKGAGKILTCGGDLAKCPIADKL